MEWLTPFIVVDYLYRVVDSLSGVVDFLYRVVDSF